MNDARSLWRWGGIGSMCQMHEESMVATGEQMSRSIVKRSEAAQNKI